MRKQAMQVYQGMWLAMAQAEKTSDWQAPELARFATGDALSAISRGLYADHVNGLVSRGEPADFPTVTSADPPSDPATVMISDCGDSTRWLQYRADTGQLADDQLGGRRAITAEARKQLDGTWKVTRFAVEGLGSC